MMLVDSLHSLNGSSFFTMKVFIIGLDLLKSVGICMYVFVKIKFQLPELGVFVENKERKGLGITGN